MDRKILFHGSGMVVNKPQVIISGFYKDFGYGFYCTEKALETLTFEGSYSL